jgi:hypothetical protein
MIVSEKKSCSTQHHEGQDRRKGRERRNRRRRRRRKRNHAKCSVAVSKTGSKVAIKVENSKGLARVSVKDEYYSISLELRYFLTYMKLKHL